MERYKKVLIVLSIIIGLSVGIYTYDAQVAEGKPFVQGGVYGGEFDYVKLSNREFTLYLTESDLHDRVMLAFSGKYKYQEFDVLVVINGLEYERSMLCYIEESSELEVEDVTIVVSFYMEKNMFTYDMLFPAGMFAVAITLGVAALFAFIGTCVEGKRRGCATAEIQETL